MVKYNHWSLKELNYHSRPERLEIIPKSFTKKTINRSKFDEKFQIVPKSGTKIAHSSIIWYKG